MNFSTEPGVRPSHPPNQSPVQPTIETTHRGSSPHRPDAYCDARRDAPVVREQVAEVVGNLGGVDVSARLQRPLRQQGRDVVAETARRGDALAVSPAFFRMPRA